MEKADKISYSIGTILVGSDMYYQKHHFFKVIGHLKSGTPKLELLETEKSKETGDPTYHDFIIKPILNNYSKECHSKKYRTPRWSSKINIWQIKIDNVHFLLRIYDPNGEYHVSSYY